jgi:hypothetical protein
MTTRTVNGAAASLLAATILAVGCGGAVENEVSLITTLGEAEKRTNLEQPGQWAVESVTIDGTTRQTILARPHSRLIYKVTVPPDAWFETAFALKPETWELPGDGAQFRVGVSDGRVYDELLRQYVNPKRGDRRWFTARLDLSAYEGRQVTVILNTDPGPPGAASDTNNDLAVWGEPRIYSKR